MSKDSTKTDAMRKAREEQWAEKQARAKADSHLRPKKAPPDPPSGVGSLDNEASTPLLPATRAKPATPEKASGAKARSVARAPIADESSSSDESDAETANNDTARIVQKVAGVFPNMPSRQPEADEARCSGCGKIRAVRNGKIAHHQKGLGKPCPGAGKPA